MEDITLNVSRFSIPTSVTAAALCVAMVTDQDQIPLEYHTLPVSSIIDKAWEEPFVPGNTWQEDYEKLEIIHKFALSLLEESEDIPEEFAKVINDDFWEIL